MIIEMFEIVSWVAFTMIACFVVVISFLAIIIGYPLYKLTKGKD